MRTQPRGLTALQEALPLAPQPKEERIAVLVLTLRILRDLVEAARAVVKSNRRPTRAGRRF